MALASKLGSNRMRSGRATARNVSLYGPGGYAVFCRDLHPFCIVFKFEEVSNGGIHQEVHAVGRNSCP